MPDTKNHHATLRNFALGTFIVAIGIVITGFTIRDSDAEALAQKTIQRAIPVVTTVKPQSLENTELLRLPGRLEAFKTASIYARADGYVKDWKFDIGSQVKAGDVLATVDTPDIDQQLAQARAELKVIKANTRLLKATADRFQELVKSNVVSAQDAEQKMAEYLASQAQVEASEADVKLLEVQNGYGHIVAPFSGIVTRRNIDVGDLVSAGSHGGEALFEVVETNTLRAYVRVPQNYISRVTVGTPVIIEGNQGTGKQYNSTVSAFSNAVDKDSGTALMQIMLNNESKELTPGSYVSVNIELPPPRNVFTLPASAVFFDAEGLNVATVSEDNRVERVPITLARDLGAVVEVKQGLTGNEQVINNPPDGIQNDIQVRVAKTQS